MKTGIETLLERKSVRRYTEEKISESDIEAIIKAGLAAPSGKDRRHCELIVVDDKEVLEKLSEALPYAKMAANAPLAIVVCGNCDPEKGGVSEYWFIDAAAMAENILLAAEALDLGAVWTATYPYSERMEPVASILSLPDNIKSLALIPIGHPIKEYKAKDKYDSSKIHYNKY